MTDAVKSTAKPRRYDASGRRARARASQREILEAARELFVRHGYGRTTIADIARTAGVSAETVYGAFKNKATLLHRVWDITIGGDDQDVVFHERPEVKALRAEPDLRRRLVSHAAFSTATARRITPFLIAASEPTAAQMLAEIGRQRYEGIGVMAREAAATGQLRVSEQECRDVIWAMTDGMLWHRLVQERGWTDEQFAGWLARIWVSALVG
jgi:AcrR family transcriptional regulator